MRAEANTSFGTRVVPRAGVAYAMRFGHDFWGAVFTLFVGPVLLRIICELILILFEINESLLAIRNERTATVEVIDVPSSTPPVV